jgi:hypothetical protein
MHIRCRRYALANIGAGVGSVFEYSFNFANLPLNFAADFLGRSSVSQIRVTDCAPGFLFNFPFCLFGPSLCPILRT